MLTAGYGPLGRSGGGAGGLLNGEFSQSPLLFSRHGPAPFPPGATPAGSLPGVRDLEIKSEPPLAPPGLSATDMTGISVGYFFSFKEFAIKLFLFFEQMTVERDQEKKRV